jgi:hypothetical protein
VVEFPCESPETAKLAKDVSAIEQLETIKMCQTEWSDNAVSATVYYRAEELDEIKAWLEANYENSVKSVSFLLHSDHNFPLPPLEEITKEQYEKMLSKIDSSIPLVNGQELDLLDISCDAGSCPIR